MASLDDVVTVQKNGVVGVNSLVQALLSFKAIYESFVGDQSAVGITSDILVTTGAGRLVNVSVITAAAGGKIYDSATVSSASDANAVFTIPNATGVTIVNFPVTNGIVVRPAAGSVISISYSES